MTWPGFNSSGIRCWLGVKCRLFGRLAILRLTKPLGAAQIAPTRSLIYNLRDRCLSEVQTGMSQFEIRVSTLSGPVESAQSVGRVARLSRNVRQPDYIPANAVAGHKAEPRPGAGEERLARPSTMGWM